MPRQMPSLSWAKAAELFAGRCYIPLVRYLDGHDQQRQRKVEELSARFGFSIVASNDVYYHHRKRKRIQDVLLAIRENRPLDKMGFRLFSNAERCLKSGKELEKLFPDRAEFLWRTLEVAERCRFDLSELRYQYPSEWIPEGLSPQQHLEDCVWKGAAERYHENIPSPVKNQIRHELALIEKLAFADYFLTIYDIVVFARSQKILCQGRGSAANSVVCYALGITAIDPVKMNLLFERFISEERGDPPDIDVDFEHERREEVIQYIYQKYGRHRSAMVCTHVCFRRRSALREVAKAFGVPVGTRSARQLEKDWAVLVPHEKDRQQIQEICEEIEGFPHHSSIHTGGFTLSADPITRIVPVVPAKMEGRTVIQWDKNDLETLGLLKVDILALGILSALRKTLDSVDLELYQLPHEDPATYSMIQKADTVGAFQIESRAQMSMLGRLQPRSFYDLVIQVAIVRPGPIVGNMVHPYLKRRRGWEQPEYPHPLLKSILGRTLGVPLFQEQVMKLAIQLAGFSPGEADQLRRAIGAWKSDGPLEPIAVRLREGLARNHLPAGWVERIFEHIRGFSEYGFPESHAASFALLAYASCYLKCHHPAHYLCSLLNSQPMGFYRVDSLIYDGLRHGLKIAPIHINLSQWDSFVDERGQIRLGFSLMRGLGEKDFQKFLEERERRPFSSARDFLRRTQWRETLLRRFIMAGRLGESRSVLWSLLAYSLEDSSDQKQRSLFEWSEFEQEDSKEIKEETKEIKETKQTKEKTKENKATKDTKEVTKERKDTKEEPEPAREWQRVDSWEQMAYDYESFGYSQKGHPLALLRKLSKGRVSNSKLLRQQKSGSSVEVDGMVLLLQKPSTARGMVFVGLEDEYGFIDLALSSTVYEEHRELLISSCFLRVKGVLQKDLNTVSVKVESLKGLAINTTP